MAKHGVSGRSARELRFVVLFERLVARGAACLLALERAASALASGMWIFNINKGRKMFFPDRRILSTKYGAGRCMQAHWQQFAHVVEKAVWKTLKKWKK